MKKILASCLLMASSFSFAGQLSFDYIQGNDSNIINQRIEVLPTADLFFDYLADRGERPLDETPALSPEYDFRTYPYIAVHPGTRTSQDSSVEPIKLVEKKDRIVLYVNEVKSCAGATVAAAPYTLISLNEPMSLLKPLSVKYIKQSGDCL